MREGSEPCPGSRICSVVGTDTPGIPKGSQGPSGSTPGPLGGPSVTPAAAEGALRGEWGLLQPLDSPSGSASSAGWAPVPASQGHSKGDAMDSKMTDICGHAPGPPPQWFQGQDACVLQAWPCSVFQPLSEACRQITPSRPCLLFPAATGD